MSGPLATFSRNLKSRGLYPFAIGFTTVFGLSAYLFRIDDEDIVHASNKRFAAPFMEGAKKRLIAKGVEVPEDAHGHH